MVSILTRLSGVLTAIAGIALVAMMALVIGDVVGKYLFNQPIQGTLEVVAYYLMVPVVFLPLAQTEVNDQHIKIELFTQNMSKKRIAQLDAMASVLSALYVGLFTWAGARKAWRMTEIFEAEELMKFDIQLWLVRWVVPISCGLLTIIFLVKAYTSYREKTGEDDHNGDEGRYD